MKILCHHRIRSKDGQFVHLEELVAAFRRAGHEVALVGPGHLSTASFGASSGIVEHLKRRLPKAVYETIESLYTIPAFVRICWAIVREKPDFVYERYNLFFPAGVWAARLLRIPIVLEVNAPLFEERAKFDGISLKVLARWSESFVWRSVDHVLPVTDVLAHRVRATGVPASRIEVVHNGIDQKKFGEPERGAALRRRMGLSAKFILGFVGFARAWHGLDRVLRYIARRRDGDLHLLLVGDGPVRIELEQLARQLGVEDSLTVTGIVSRDEVADYIHAFDIALQPAVVEYASPLKLFEYMACGKAIVAPRSPNIMEIVDDGVHAILFEPATPESLEVALDALWRDSDLRHRLGLAAAKRIFERRLTWDDNAARVATIGCQLVMRRGTAR